MRTQKQQLAKVERERNRTHDTARTGVSLADFPNGRDKLRRCYDCWDLLEPGEGCMQVRGTGKLARKKLVCRDRTTCATRRPKAQPRSREEM